MPRIEPAHLAVRPCVHCGKELLWGAARWPIETTPRHPDLCEARAYVFERIGRRFVMADVRDLPEPPEDVYPQHVCRVWQQQQAQQRADARRLSSLLGRVAG